MTRDNDVLGLWSYTDGVLTITHNCSREEWERRRREAYLRQEARRADLAKRAPKCTACETDQVQLVDWYTPVRWRCRQCSHQFEFTPEGMERW
jgi:hypothetical protein